MRTNDLRGPSSIRILGYLSAAGAIGVALAACSSSTHLDPPGATATGTGGESPTSTSVTSSTSGGGGGGGAPMDLPCKSNPDCPFPTSVCDTIAHECRECLVDADCASKGAGPVCSAGKCGCAKAGEQFCAAAGAPAGGACVDKMTATTDCGACGHACFGACAAGKCADPWEPTSLVGAPAARSHHVAVWDETDKRMIVWGGGTSAGATATGGVYDPATNTWTATSAANAPSARVDPTAVWDDTEKVMIVWGGRDAGGNPLATGGLYDPMKNMWKTMSSPGDVLSARSHHTAVWTGSKMIVWGGLDSTGARGDGAIYKPASDSWTAVAPSLAPTPRYDHTAVWTGDAMGTMIIWGGYGIDPVAMTNIFLGDSAAFDTNSSTWSAPLSSGPSSRSQATAVWIAESMIVWGGSNLITGKGNLSDGAKYSGGSWLTLSGLAPAARAGHSAAKIKAKAGDKMIVWGGQNTSGYLNTGALLDPTSLDWDLSMPTAPVGRAYHSTVVNGMGGSKMIIWGGDTNGGVTNSGAIFDASTM